MKSIYPFRQEFEEIQIESWQNTQYTDNANLHDGKIDGVYFSGIISHHQNLKSKEKSRN